MHLMYDCSAPSNSEKEKSNLLKNPTITHYSYEYDYEVRSSVTKSTFFLLSFIIILVRTGSQRTQGLCHTSIGTLSMLNHYVLVLITRMFVVIHV